MEAWTQVTRKTMELKEVDLRITKKVKEFQNWLNRNSLERREESETEADRPLLDSYLGSSHCNKHWKHKDK